MFTNFVDFRILDFWTYGRFHKYTALKKYMSFMKYRINSALSLLKYSFNISLICRWKIPLCTQLSDDKKIPPK